MCNCTEIFVDDNEAFEDEFEVDDAKLYVSSVYKVVPKPECR